MDEMPAKIGKYDVTSVAGRGNMGVVYIGHDPFVDRKVAIKVALDRGFDSDPNQLARKMFFNEARSAGALDHPNILRVYEAGEDNGQPYMVMEYVEGADTLKSYTQRDKLLPIERVCELMKQCAEALDYAHQHGVIHRDIKPANLMLTSKGTIKIGDFGVAQRVRSDQTQILGWFGSPQYMSPEQARDEELNSQSDLFSLGSVMYELLTGRHAFEAKGISGLVNKILNQEPEQIRVVRPEIPDSVAAIVHRCLQKDIAKRYKRGREIADDLAKAIEEMQNPHALMTEEQRFQVVRELKFFQDFSNAEVAEVMKAAHWDFRRAGERIITEGEDEHALYIIVDGTATVLVRDKEVAKLGKGDCFGEMGYLSSVKRSASVMPTSRVALLKIDKPIKQWASLPCQLRFNKAIQGVLIERLARTSEDLAKHLP